MENKYIVVAVVVIVAVIGIGYVASTEFLIEENNDNNSNNGNNSNNSDNNDDGNMSRDPFLEGVNTIDTEKNISVENTYNETRTVELEVKRNSTGEVVHTEEYELEPNSSLSPAYTLSVNETETIPSFTITATVGDQTEAIDIQMNQCYGNAYVEVQSDGNLYAFYSIC